MPRRIAEATLNASTLDILNVIRENASLEYQNLVPEVVTEKDIPKVGDVLYGHPALANQFINGLVNGIALRYLQSATFNNPYVRLKKGLIERGETIEEIFVGLVKAIKYSAEKAGAREFKRTLPDVKTAFHAMNWRVLYPITIQQNDLQLAFETTAGVTNLITRIIDQIYTSAEYDEFLLFKYMLIKAIAHGKMYTYNPDSSNLTDHAVAFRGISNTLPFMKKEYNEAGVLTTTPKNRQIIFMDANYNASFDVNVLAGAFNMEKADFMGSLFLIDDWGTFDNERFEVIRAESDGIEEVTDAELVLASSTKAVIVDENWFQIYDNLNTMSEKYVASGLYWNYFYHTWKTISYSPFANAICISHISGFVFPKLTVTGIEKSDTASIITLVPVEGVADDGDEVGIKTSNINLVQTEALTEVGIAVHPYGVLIIPSTADATEVTIEVVNTNTGAHYTSEDFDLTDVTVGQVIALVDMV